MTNDLQSNKLSGITVALYYQKTIMITLKKRPGLTPFELNQSDLRKHCPDVLETEDGDFLVIGKDVTGKVDLSEYGASVSDSEKIVLVPRITMFSAINGLKEAKEL